MNLVLDIGNSSAKIALFDNNKLIEKAICSINEIHEILVKKEFKRGIICSVNNTELAKDILKKNPSFIYLNEKLKLPINNLYKTPQTLGYDRLANAVGAYKITPNENNLIIDMGTCIKFDLLNNKNEYLGGSISPGIQMRYKALNTFTAKLPLMDDIHETTLVGANTQESIVSGVINGVVSEVDSMLQKYQQKYEKLNIYITGGDAQVYISIADTQKSSIFAHDYLTLLGLNAILEENAN